MRCITFLALAASTSAAVVVRQFAGRDATLLPSRADGSRTNAARFAAGLPPLPPKERRTPAERALKPRATTRRRDLNSNGFLRMNSAPEGVTGTIRIDRSDTGQPIGYVSRTLNQNYGWFVPTKNPSEFLTVSLPKDYEMGSGRTAIITLENLSSAYPSCAACQYLALTQNGAYGDVGAGRAAYLWMTAADAMNYGTGPQRVASSRAAGGTGYASESDIWTIDSDGTIGAKWFNMEGGDPVNVSGAFNRAIGSELDWTGDFKTYRHFGEKGPTRPGPNTASVPIKFTFVADEE